MELSIHFYIFLPAQLTLAVSPVQVLLQLPFVLDFLVVHPLHLLPVVPFHQQQLLLLVVQLVGLPQRQFPVNCYEHLFILGV